MSFIKIFSLVAAILATACIAALLTLQYLEFKHYRDVPSVWPVGL